MSLLDAALQWASEGVPVFPVRGKIPRTGHGVKDATTDAARIEAWWAEYPAAGIGGATGSPCGSWVLDIDGDEGRRSLAKLEAAHGNLPPTLTCRTGGGGEHRWWRMPGDRPVGNRAGVVPSIDVRGTGGYVVLPPSPHPSGATYQLVLVEEIAEAPRWLLDLVAPRRVDAPSIEAARVQGIVRAACERIRAAPPGQRNDTVNREAYGVGGYLRAAGLRPEDVEAELAAAAVEAEQPAETAARALRDGYDRPRELPPTELQVRPQVRGLRDDEPDPDVGLDVRINEEKGTETVLATLPNAIAILDGDRRWARRIRWDQFALQLGLDGRPITDAAEGEIVVWISRAYGVTLPLRTVHDAIVTVAARHAYHPVQEYLRGLRWDGTPRIDTWLTTYAGAEEDPIGYGSRFLVSAVARILSPGCQVDQVLVLSDPRQGRGKTSLIRTLASLAWASDTQLPIGEKDACVQLQGVWLYELGELAALRRHDLESIKSFVTARHDKYRPAYGRNVVVQPRQCVFVGTTNETRVLPEGGRRWWVVRITRSVDLLGLARDRDQLWAEAVYRYTAGEPWHLTGEADEAQRLASEAHVQRDPWESPLAEWLVGRGPVTTAMALDALGVAIADRTRADELRVGRVLETLGLTVQRRYVAGTRLWWWSRP